MTIKGGWEDRSDVSCPAYGFRCGIRERSGEEGYMYSRAAITSSNMYLMQCIFGECDVHVHVPG